MPSRYLGILLAAGAGTRYGQPKILAHDGAWLRTATATLQQGGCARVYIATGAARPPLPLGTTELHVEAWTRGLGATVHAAIAAVTALTCNNDEHDNLVLHTIDTPDVGPDVLARLIAHHPGPAGITRAHYQGRPGHPVIIGRDHWQPLLASLSELSGGSSDAGARHYLRERDVLGVECGDLATGADIDYPGC
ncbi:nucleotidyltransferase family protein [Lolliginicoccus suaedae]|uniref:nucleotidyltransferase family protein n=1 Tax=Lolliginicoccus suaedae TaxID=2605429 RepID=UPI0011ED7F28|nr:NTP transferase domain-containing protein [Lolliginicoccus suaedae]